MKIIHCIFISLLFFFTIECRAASHADSTTGIVDTTDILNGLDLKNVPGIDTLHKVAKKYLGRWAHLFLAIKIEESGNSGHYSWLSLKHFNLCGMRFPKSRRTYAIGATNTNYAIYRNWFECMLDFKIYMDIMDQKYLDKHKKAPKTDIDMITFMFNSFNHFAKWKKDMLILIKYVKRKYP